MDELRTLNAELFIVTGMLIFFVVVIFLPLHCIVVAETNIKKHEKLNYDQQRGHKLDSLALFMSGCCNMIVKCANILPSKNHRRLEP